VEHQLNTIFASYFSFYGQMKREIQTDDVQ